MEYVSYRRARDLSWQVLIDCHICALPVKITSICRKMGIGVFKYSVSSQTISHLGMYEQIEDTDAFSTTMAGKPVIFYNDRCNNQRCRYAIAHELGHILLGHINKKNPITLINREVSPEGNSMEEQADTFASRLLAPACVLYGIDAGSAEEISKVCGISMTASQIRMKRMEVLYTRKAFMQSHDEQKLYIQFLDFIDGYCKE